MAASSGTRGPSRDSTWSVVRGDHSNVDNIERGERVSAVDVDASDRTATRSEPREGNPLNKDGASPRSRPYLELGEHRDPIGGEPPPRSADGVRETNSRGRCSGRRTASARRSLSARATRRHGRLPRARQTTRGPCVAKQTSPTGVGLRSHGCVFSLNRNHDGSVWAFSGQNCS